jgi:thiosulfate dehydrogenase (quinone) large subunit
MQQLKKLKKILFSDSSLANKKIGIALLLVVQVLFGLLWLEGALWKIRVNGAFAWNYEGLYYWAKMGVDHPVLGLYKEVLLDVILPNIRFFTPVIFFTELLTGLLFIAGKYIRIAAILAVTQTIAIMLSVLYAPHEWHWTYYMMLLLSIVLFVRPAAFRQLRNKK